jgi:hypothetical protein
VSTIGGACDARDVFRIQFSNSVSSTIVFIPNAFTFVVPALSRDPYAVCSRFGKVAGAFQHNPRQGLWVPAFAGTTWMGDRVE